MNKKHTGRKPKPVCLIILDGFGVAPAGETNAVTVARTPRYDSYWLDYPHATLSASGLDVGLPEGQMGNSEVGHLNIGAGRVVYQELTKIDRSIEDGSFFANPVLIGAMEAAKRSGRALHLMGLLSDGGVHTSNAHLYALLELAKRTGVEKVFVHCFLDGRDTPPQSAQRYIAELEAKFRDIGVGRIASVCGRYYAMDRDRRWERIKRAYDMLVGGAGATARTAAEAVEQAYAAGENDEFAPPTVVGVPALISAGDSVVFFNFRSDRARELTTALTAADFDRFDRGTGPPPIKFVCLTRYDKEFDLEVAFEPQRLNKLLVEILAERGLRQLHIAETEKYAHVTFFFNGGTEEPAAGEDRILIPSPKVATYDQKPEMSALEVADKTAESIRSGKYDFVIVNFANPDMVGHTGRLDAAVRALETVDEAISRVVDAVRAANGVAMITADHGNAERMAEDGGDPLTAHTLSPVPFILIGAGPVHLRAGARLADIAPTILSVMDLPAPPEMTGRSLIVGRADDPLDMGKSL